MIRADTSEIETVYINGRFLSQKTTGVQRYAEETLQELDRLASSNGGLSDLRFSVLAPPDARVPRLRTIDFERVGGLTGNAWEQLTLLRATRNSLVLSFGPTGPLLKRHQIVTMHDAAVYRMPDSYSWRFRAWYKLALPILAKRAALVMTVSEFSKRELASCLALRDSKVLVSGEGWQHVEREPADQTILTRHALATGRYVLGVGSQSPHKNFSVLARAAQLLRSSEAQVVVAGGANAKVFGGAAPAGPSTLNWVGYVDDAQLRALYESAAAFIYPSRYEGFGIPPLEAMALGCPVIAARAAAIPEVCEDAAWYFDPDDEVALATLIDRAFQDEDARARLIERGRALLAKHSWTGSARMHVLAVRQLSRNASTPR
jgi:glycosyltransferase involved in cell wall biosynthesis